jgi:hypothetical protein
LALDALAIGPVLKLGRVPKVFGLVLLSPVLLISLTLMLFLAACETSITSREDAKGSCVWRLGEVKQNSYSVDLVQDECGGVLGTSAIFVEQRKSLFSGFYFFRTIAVFDPPYQGGIGTAGQAGIETVGAGQVRVRIPERGVDRVYTLKGRFF